MTDVYKYLNGAQHGVTRVVDNTAIVQALTIVDIGGFTYTTDLHFPGANKEKYPQPLSFQVTEPADLAAPITCGYRYADRADFTSGVVTSDELMGLFKEGTVPASLRDATAFPDLASLLGN